MPIWTVASTLTGRNTLVSTPKVACLTCAPLREWQTATLGWPIHAVRGTGGHLHTVNSVRRTSESYNNITEDMSHQSQQKMVVIDIRRIRRHRIWYYICYKRAFYGHVKCLRLSRVIWHKNKRCFGVLVFTQNEKIMWPKTLIMTYHSDVWSDLDELLCVSIP